MKPKTELFLYQLLWTADSVMRPTFRNLDSSFEGWCYRQGLLRQVQRLEEADFLEVERGSDRLARVCRLTEAGRLQALGGRDPQERWDRGWDGIWRTVMFDLPETQRALRTKLRRVLAGQRLGCLQKSVWITPDSLGDLVGQLQSIVTTPEVLVFFEGRTFGGESPVAIAEAAWNFEEINRRWKDYAAHLRGLRKREEGLTVAGLEDWAKEDRRLWVRCLASDPLLPRELLPPAYGGLSAWKARGPVLRRAAELGRELIAKL